MKVLFISSGNTGDAGIIVRNQAVSLEKKGIKVDHFLIKGKGLRGYLKNIITLRKYLKISEYDILHAHYGLSGIVAGLARNQKIVVSLMGSDIFYSRLIRLILILFCRLRWDATIVKSHGMKERLGYEKAHVIPNGVDIEKFSVMDRELSRKRVGLTGDRKIILFIASPSRLEKNYPLAEDSVRIAAIENTDLLVLDSVPNDEIPFYMNSADLLLLTSKWEGSANIVKEAMACNLPVVSTDVGDVRQNLEGLDGCYISGHDASELAGCIRKALLSGKRTDGRQRILRKGLDSATVADRLISLYEETIKS